MKTITITVNDAGNVTAEELKRIIREALQARGMLVTGVMVTESAADEKGIRLDEVLSNSSFPVNDDQVYLEESADDDEENEVFSPFGRLVNHVGDL